jgi:hypothetical protein
MNPETQDEDVLRFAAQNNYVLITCNRDDFLAASEDIPHCRPDNSYTTYVAASGTSGSIPSPGQGR